MGLARDLRSLIADLVDPDDIFAFGSSATESPIDTPLWDVLANVTASVHPGAELIPSMLAAQTDARHLRPAGTVTYGFGLLSQHVNPQNYWSRFHGVDERIELESLELAVMGWQAVVRQFLE